MSHVFYHGDKLFPGVKQETWLLLLGFLETESIMPYSGRDIALFVIAFFFPPIAVWIRRGLCTTDFLINVCLTLLGASMYPETLRL